MSQTSVLEPAPSQELKENLSGSRRVSNSSAPLPSVRQVVQEHWRLAASIFGGTLLACLVYCLVVPRQYEAQARVALRITPATGLNLDGADAGYSGSLASGQTQLETLAGVFRSDQLAWRVIVEKKLYNQQAFAHGILERSAELRPEGVSPETRARLLERFQDSLRVRTIPRTLLLEIRFRCRDAALSAAVVNALIQDYQEEESETHILATAKASGWLEQQLQLLKARSDRDEEQLAEFQRKHGLLIAPGTASSGQADSAEHIAPLREVDDLANELVAASSDRILREAEYRAAMQGDPELVVASDPHLQSEAGGSQVTAIRELHARRSALEEEQAQLAPEHGPNFPRSAEIREQIQDLDKQLQAEDAKLRERFKSAWQTAQAREEMVRKNLEERTNAGQETSAAIVQYERMRREADASQELYLRMQDKVASAGLAAGVHGSDFWIVDPAQPPVKTAVPAPAVDFAIAIFVGVWLALGGAFLMENLRPSSRGLLLIMFAFTLCEGAADGQAPTPSTSGLPTGVARIPQSTVTRPTPNAKEVPSVWNTGGPAAMAADGRAISAELPGPIVSGDLLEVSEYHTPEFHSTVRVSAGGTVLLPMVGEVAVQGMDETGAARAVAAALVDKGILTHPQVNVLVTAFVGQDVTVVGEVARPGVYPYGAHHRLLDLISAASGLSPAAGSLVSITHREEPGEPELIPLDGLRASAARNPELRPGDTVQVSRAGVVYVVGDVMRPGGFTMEPAQPMTVLQAVSLAWGPTQNAVANKVLLIHEQNGNRMVTTLNLKRMLRGLDPDMPIGERDILFVPGSAMKNLWNRSLESVVQSAAGVSIYAGLVYSQRF